MLSRIGLKLFNIVEYIGESVVSFLGIDDSMFQDVLDNMTEEEMKLACEVDFERQEEYRMLYAAQQSVIAAANAPYAEENGGIGMQEGERAVELSPVNGQQAQAVTASSANNNSPPSSLDTSCETINASNFI
jgi:hypothetical protein